MGTKDKRQDLLKSCRLLYTENPTLGVGFREAKGGEDDKKLLLLIIEVRSANCTTKSKRRSSDDGE